MNERLQLILIGWVIYSLPFLLTIVAWYLWARTGGSNVGRPWRRKLTIVALVAVSASLGQSALLVTYERLLHHDVFHFSRTFSLWVYWNLLLCTIGVIGYALGIGRARVPLLLSSLLMGLLWLVTQVP